MSKRFEVDGDWVDAGMALFGFFYSALLFGVDLWRVVRSPLAVRTTVSWQTYLGLGVGLWFLAAVVRWPKPEEHKRLRRLLLLLSFSVLVSEGSRLALHWSHASSESWRLAAGFLNYTGVLVWGGLLALIIGWFNEKVRLVERAAEKGQERQ